MWSKTLPSDQRGDLAGDHLLLAVFLVRQPFEAEGVLADLGLVPGSSVDLALFLVRVAGEADEHEHDADVHDVAAVAPLAARHQADQRREGVELGVRLAHARAAIELLRDRRGDERAQREADHRGPATSAHARVAEADARPPSAIAHRRRGSANWSQVSTRCLAPGDERPDAGEEQQDQADRRHRLVEERRPDGDAVAARSTPTASGTSSPSG